ncbi:MAG: cation transporter [Bacteroidetes bacterium]|uniref:Cation transporter n=1 Tax=Candidatus Cryptobacteroides intestinavium TaxID=2840766 RepID=A0A9D9EWJ6_9BACT|nr:cation transporter [Candidatus Cryptobacteroides intestinavium]
MEVSQREKRIMKVTLTGMFVNVVLSAGKIAAGVFGRSSAMLADGVHSLSDLLTDIIVIAFVRVSSKGRDRSHEFGHGKYETLATLLVSLILIVVAAQMMVSGIGSITNVLDGGTIPVPGYVALAAAVISIVAKELLYRYTIAVGRKTGSPAVEANAWHHRSDAFSSIGSLIGISGAIFLGDNWVILDPLVCCCISIAIFVVAVKMAGPSLNELLDGSLPEESEKEIVSLAMSVEGVRNIHNLKTRRSGLSVMVEAHLVVDPDMTVEQAHEISTAVENAIVKKFGNETQISIHIEPSEAAK